jgi:parallel beta-helix repeat protein
MTLSNGRGGPHRRTLIGVAAGVLGLIALGTGMSYAAEGDGARAVSVGSAAELTAALADAQPGDVITMAAGEYDGTFFATTSGTADAPITLTGPRTAVLSNTKRGCDPNVPDGGKVKYCGLGLHLNKVDSWRLTGFSVRDSAKGIVLDSANNNVIDGVEVSDVEDEGIHFRTASADNVLRNSSVHDTGTKQPGFGEGVYLGSAVSNWPKFGENGGTGPDRSDRNVVENNEIGPNVAAELIDIKEGTIDGLISGNTFDGDGMTGENSADSWIDAKGNDYVLEKNTGTFSGDGTFVDGYQTHQQTPDAGCGNTWRANESDLGGASGFAINATNQSKCGSNPNVVATDNTVTGAGKGLTNITATD